ncbi:hypothetical protein [Metabacillus sp. Hm71]|uniref:hypothetical protein n=1 Tax=Metabacillus sp. Hm71 TaxID=3450743 RepID=UPI003F4253FF
MKHIRKQTSTSQNWLLTALVWYVLILFAGSVTNPTSAYYRDEKQMNGSITIGTWESNQQQTSDEESTERKQNDESNQTAELNKVIEKESEQKQVSESAKENNPEEDIDPAKTEEEGEMVENEEADNMD